jgi:galactitol-specific phosphotransferase system IIC component
VRIVFGLAQEATYAYGSAWHVIILTLLTTNVVLYCLMLTSTLYRVDGKVHTYWCFVSPLAYAARLLLAGWSYCGVSLASPSP